MKWEKFMREWEELINEWKAHIKAIVERICFAHKAISAFHLSLSILKSDSHLPKKICLIERPLKVMKNAFYFVLKALSVLKIFKLLSLVFGHLGKTAWLEK